MLENQQMEITVTTDVSGSEVILQGVGGWVFESSEGQGIFITQQVPVVAEADEWLGVTRTVNQILTPETEGRRLKNWKIIFECEFADNIQSPTDSHAAVECSPELP